MRILGIDPGLRVTGFGVIDQHGHKLSYVASGTIKTADADLPSRLGTIFEGISTLIRQHSPDQSAIEKVFVNVNPQSTLLLGQARGAAICGLVAGGVPVAEYTAHIEDREVDADPLDFFSPPPRRPQYTPEIGRAHV